MTKFIKSEAQEIRNDDTNIDKYIVVAHFTEYLIISKLIFLIIIILKVMMIRQLFHKLIKNVKIVMFKMDILAFWY